MESEDYVVYYKDKNGEVQKTVCKLPRVGTIEFNGKKVSIERRY